LAHVVHVLNMGCCFSWCCCCKLPPKFNEDLLLDGQEGIVQIASSDCSSREKARAVITRSFSGTASTDPEGTFDWMLGPHLKDKWDDPRRHMMLGWFVQLMEKMVHEKVGGFCMVCHLDSGEFGAVILVVPKLHGMINTPCTLLCSMIALMCCDIGMPPLKAMGEAKKGIEKRMKALDQITEIQKKHVLKTPHIYVNVMAVDPSAQGQGLCSKAMRKASEFADARNLPLYLETSGEKNVKIYERFGYVVLEQFTVTIDNDPDKAKPHTDEFAMMRPAKNP